MSTTINAGNATSGAAISADTTGILQLQSGSTPTTAITVDGSQNVGIGTSSPSYRFDCQNNQNATVNFRFANTNTVDTNTRTALNVTAGNRNVYLQSINADHNYLNWTAGTNLYFQNGAATIDSSGNLLVGTTSNAPNSKINCSWSTANAWQINFTNTATSGDLNGVLTTWTGSAPNNTTSYFYYGADNASARFYVRGNGGIGNFSGNNVNLSDRREKTNFAPAGDYLSKICAIPVQTFNYIDQNIQEDDGLTLGVVAQDVQTVAPELVTESNWAKDGDIPKMRLSIYQTDLQYALMKAIQELNAKVDAQALEIQALKGAA